jgi:hypothetical protein
MHHLLIPLHMTPVIPLKYRKHEKVNFLTPIFLRTDAYVWSYEGDSDSP